MFYGNGKQVLVPSETKTLHLYEARYLALLEEVLLLLFAFSEEEEEENYLKNGHNKNNNSFYTWKFSR